MRPREVAVINVHIKIRGIAGGLVAKEFEFPDGLTIGSFMGSTTKNIAGDYELVAPNGSRAELEIRAHRADAWTQCIAEYSPQKLALGEFHNRLIRLAEQIRTETAQGCKMYIALSDSLPSSMRFRMQIILEEVGIERTQIVYMSEMEILKAVNSLCKHMSIPLPAEDK
jgi:hypothetical protein